MPIQHHQQNVYLPYSSTYSSNNNYYSSSSSRIPSYFHSPQLGGRNGSNRRFQRRTQLSRDQLLGGSLRQSEEREQQQKQQKQINNKQNNSQITMSPPLAMRRLSRKCQQWLSGRRNTTTTTAPSPTCHFNNINGPTSLSLSASFASPVPPSFRPFRHREMKQRRVTNGDFLGLLERMQSQRMDEQRCYLPFNNNKNGSGSGGFKVGNLINN
uniref:Uncharacterized protein n=1 Tax=Meloidogyne enterolobii TaxID=390850 RepID=A0A6V7TZC6_MELEN|nr:unnamed protein product [Meloidogyne enterolobii]